MSNYFKYNQIVADKFAFELWNSLRIASKVDRRLESKYQMEATKPIGPTIECKKQRRFLTADGLTYVKQPITDQTFSLTVDQIKHVGMSMDVFEQTYKADGTITDMASKDIKSAANSLADAVDRSLMQLGGKRIFNAMGVPGTIPGSTSATDTQQKAADGKMYIAQAGVPENTKKMCFMNSRASGYVPASLSSLFVREAQEAVRDGKIGHAVGLDFYESNNTYRHTAGTAITNGSIASGISTTDFTVNGASQTGSSLILASSASQSGYTFLEGDILYLDVYSVNVVNKDAFPTLQQFIVTANATADASGDVTVSISPSIVTSGAYQNVSASPSNGATVYGYNTGMHNLIITPDTLALVCIPYKELKGGVICNVATYKDISIMLTVWGDGTDMSQNARVDIAYGVAGEYPETGCIWLGE